MSGRVYLVGAGPGDPGLLTLRAAEVLGEADVVVLDALVPEALLVHAPRAQALRAGKRYGDHSMSQDEINALLVSLAREGKTVVRLKGGDPFVFGRGGEECQALAAAGIPFEVVPGVTSAVAVPAYAGIPLTHRDLAHSFAVVTGHVGAHEAVRAAAIGADTVVFLMGVTMLAENCRALVDAGRSPDTPVAVIRRGTTSGQRTVTGTLATIADEARRAGIEPPAVAVVGRVVDLRQTIAWFERRPLFGRRILVTRSRHQASALADRLTRMGAEPVAFPTIEIAPPDSFEPLDRAIAGISRYTHLVLTSQNGVRAFFERLGKAGLDSRRLAHLRVAAIGPATAEALEAHGVRPDVVAREYRAEGLVREMAREGLAGARILVARAAKAREVLVTDLQRAGAEVEVVAAYRTLLPEGPDAGVRGALEAGEIDAVTFTSASTVDNFCALVGSERAPGLLASTIVACIGPITRDAALAHGIACQVMPAEYTIQGLCDALAEHFAGASPK